MKLNKTLILLSLTLFSFCKSTQNSAEASANNVTQSETAQANSNIQDNMKHETDPPSSLQQGMTDFAFRFFKQQSEENHMESFCVSPVSLEVALGMAYVGAKTETAIEMSHVLGFPLSTEDFLAQMTEYYTMLKQLELTDSIEFSVANRVFLEKSYLLLDSYTSAMKNAFGGEFEQMDFLSKTREAEQKINQWVEEVTRNRIKQLIRPGLLDASTVMVLVNAIYFKADWKYAFDEKSTLEMPFYSGERGKVDRFFMRGKMDRVKYLKYKDYQILELPYVGEAFSLMVVLPGQSSASDIHTRILTAEEYAEVNERLLTRDVYVELPKFKIESSFELANILAAMGMPLAFSNMADFSGIGGRKDLKISKVIQKVFFEITEKGSEAAAATAVVMTRTSSAIKKPEEEIKFIANRPFIFVLKENKTHSPLFIGQYTGRD